MKNRVSSIIAEKQQEILPDFYAVNFPVVFLCKNQ